MKWWNKMFTVVISVEVCIFGNIPGKLLEDIASLCYCVLIWHFFFYNTATIILHLFQRNHVQCEIFH